MKIGIDARMFGPKQGGLGRYVEQLVLNLEKMDQSNDYVIFLNQTNFNNYQPQNPRFKKVLAGIKWYGWREQFDLPALIKKSRVDLMHWPHWNVPFFYRGPFVVTIHDLILIHYPSRVSSTLGPVTYWLKYLVFRFILWHAIVRAKKIITPSEFTKKDILKHFSVPADKIVVTYEGVGEFMAGDDKLSPAVKKPYMLYVGVAYPHKNLAGLMDAFKIFYEKYSKEYNLILAGPDNYFYRKLKYPRLFGGQAISYIGFVSDSELRALYKNASLYVFPSLYEGFGLPGLEALSFGLPVVAAGNSCLPEILGEAALYFDPRDPEEMARVISQALKDGNLRVTLAQKGAKQLGRYQWKKCAQETLQIYKNVL
ncbi:MAG: glycosyltransferase family 1 protein [Patescibacteria group bacterium]